MTKQKIIALLQELCEAHNLKAKPDKIITLFSYGAVSFYAYSSSPNTYMIMHDRLVVGMFFTQTNSFRLLDKAHMELNSLEQEALKHLDSLDRTAIKHVSNTIQCNHCNDIIESKHRHDMVWCSCKKVAVDGGLDYLKRSGNREDYTELSKSIKVFNVNDLVKVDQKV